MGTGERTARYKRATAPLDGTERARLWEGRLGESGSPENSAELADLVDSFYDEEVNDDDGGRGDESDTGSEEKEVGNRDRRAMLEAALAKSEADSVANRIRVEAEGAVRAVGSDTAGPKRRVMSWLRERGFDAGLCKSSWERAKRVPAGHHDFIDVIAGGGTRYILEIDLPAEFEIARPTSDYLTLLGPLPAVYVGRPEVLKGIVKLMCAAAKESMRSAGMHVPPWRRGGYVQMKWFGSYTRTTSRIPVGREEVGDGGAMAAGVTRPGIAMGQRFCRMRFRCRELQVNERNWPMAFRGT
ncbi:uncharacterized protein LOC103713613 [Phoenix dactylifera]|uniref:Uncharacterized protein LOC103713613 n=1 Tax=Phoenix dactylifera TaxID=42345 RepID=A0A8B7CGU3_PHODC|nr:uncharacterized protein LOC103713613 [Phoenix dactylifera]